MPGVNRRRSSTQGDTAPTVDRSQYGRTSDDAQDTLGNAAVAQSVQSSQTTTTEQSTTEEQTAVQGQVQQSTTDTAGVAPEVQKPDLAKGKTYKLTANDIEWAESATWQKVARDHGMMAELLVGFNQQVQTVDAGTENEHEIKKTPTLEAGVEIYIPSADEIAFAQIRHRAGSMEAAVSEWTGFKDSANMEILRTARERASGKIGKGYGTAGDGGVFYTQNPELVGASKRRSEKINGEREYRVAWGADFWKCSIFMHDVTYAAGFKPDVTDNKHYRLAGQLQWSKMYREIAVSKARPGNLWQRFGGTGSDESHNAVLSSFVTVEDIDEDWERWTFNIIGAEGERAAESARSHRIKKGTNENDMGQKVRFFEPKEKR